MKFWLQVLTELQNREVKRFCGRSACPPWNECHYDSQAFYIAGRGKRRCPFPRALIPKTKSRPLKQKIDRPRPVVAPLLYITPGIVLGKFLIHNRFGIVIGGKFQVAATSFHHTNHNGILSIRSPF